MIKCIKFIYILSVRAANNCAVCVRYISRWYFFFGCFIFIVKEDFLCGCKKEKLCFLLLLCDWSAPSHFSRGSCNFFHLFRRRDLQSLLYYWIDMVAPRSRVEWWAKSLLISDRRKTHTHTNGGPISLWFVLMLLSPISSEWREREE